MKWHLSYTKSLAPIGPISSVVSFIDEIPASNHCENALMTPAENVRHVCVNQK